MLHCRTLWPNVDPTPTCPPPASLLFVRWFSHFAKMLRLRMLSGEAVTSIPVEEIHDVRALKQRLAQRHGLPPRFRQRVLFQGEILEDTVTLDSPMNLDLVVLPFAEVSQGHIDDLVAAAFHCSVSQARGFESVRVHEEISVESASGLEHAIRFVFDTTISPKP